MAKTDFVPQQDNNMLVWHDQFKTGVLANAATFGLVAGDTTPITNDNTDGVNLYSKRDGDADFIFLARDTATPYIDTRSLLTAGKPEIREYKAMFVLSDEEIGIFSHELVVNCAP